MSLAEKLSEAPIPTLTGKCTTTGDELVFENVTMREPIQSDWSPVFAVFNKDPEAFEIVDDTVKESTWQQQTSAGNTVNLYAYSARFRRKRQHVDKLAIEEMVRDIRSWRYNNTYIAPASTPPVTAWFGNADMQLGKSEGGGTKETLKRFWDDVELFQRRILEQRRQGYNVNSICFANMGDPTEAVAGHYASQSASVDLNQREQLLAALEAWKTALGVLVPMVDEFHFINTLCNHGEWNRQGGKNFMGDSDNSAGFLGDTLRMMFSQVPNFDHIEWHLPHDEMITTATLSGVPIAAAHGHKVTGNLETWLTRQTGLLRYEREHDTKLWLLAHRHHAYLQDFGAYHVIQHSTLDGGSKSYTDSTGKWSTPGTTTMLIGKHNPRNFSHYEVI